MTKPQKDMPELDAAEVEANGDDRSITIAGLTLTIPKKIKYVKVARLFNAGDEFGALEVMLGPEQMAALEDLEMTEEDLNSLNEQMAKALGADPGKLPSSLS